MHSHILWFIEYHALLYHIVYWILCTLIPYGVFKDVGPSLDYSWLYKHNYYKQLGHKLLHLC